MIDMNHKDDKSIIHDLRAAADVGGGCIVATLTNSLCSSSSDSESEAYI